MKLYMRDELMSETVASQEAPETSALCDGAASAIHVPQSSDAAMKVRGLCLTILAVVATVFALHWAQKFLIPLVFGVFIAYTLNPLVAAMERTRIPRLLGTCVVMLSLSLCIA